MKVFSNEKYLYVCAKQKDPVYISGLVPLRGVILSLLDLQTSFGIQSKDNRIMVFDSNFIKITIRGKDR